MIITRVSKRDFFYISDKPEKEILKKFKKSIILGIYGGGAIILVCLALILNFFGII